MRTNTNKGSMNKGSKGAETMKQKKKGATRAEYAEAFENACAKIQAENEAKKAEHEKMATWERNEERKGIEITFKAKPSADVRKLLKAFGFRWHSAKKLWYAKETEERVRIASFICEATIEQ